MKTVTSALFQNRKEGSGTARNTDSRVSETPRSKLWGIRAEASESSMAADKPVNPENIFATLQKHSGDRGEIIMADKGGKADIAD